MSCQSTILIDKDVIYRGGAGIDTGLFCYPIMRHCLSGCISFFYQSGKSGEILSGKCPVYKDGKLELRTGDRASPIIQRRQLIRFQLTESVEPNDSRKLIHTEKFHSPDALIKESFFPLNVFLRQPDHPHLSKMLLRRA